MALLLNLDTATEIASICISLDGASIGYKQNEHKKEHASFVHLAIKEMLEEGGFKLEDFDAFSVTSGPGSYTGLRVGMAAVKGFCYAFSKPLIAVNTLEAMASAALDTIDNKNELDILCPMIDARRIEVFTALYDADLKTIFPPQPLVLDEKTFDYLLTERQITFFGSGSEKFQKMKTGSSAMFKNVESNAKNLATLAERDFNRELFADVSYSQPQYFKDFFTPSKLN